MIRAFPPLDGRYLAGLLAARAKCFLAEDEVDAAVRNAEKALALHANCGDAFLVRGQASIGSSTEQIGSLDRAQTVSLELDVAFVTELSDHLGVARGTNGQSECPIYHEGRDRPIKFPLPDTQGRRKRGEFKDALGDLVNAFVLNGSLSGGPDDGGEAQDIEDVSREACREQAR